MKEIPELRAPEKRRTGIEIRPNVRYPDQTEAAISFAPECYRFLKYAKRRKCSLQPTSSDLARKKGYRRLKHHGRGTRNGRPNR